MGRLTERERACLEYLDRLMEANAAMIGRAVIDQCGVQNGASNIPGVGAGLAGSLRKRGLVVRLPDLNAWRITPAGRSALEGEKDAN